MRIARFDLYRYRLPFAEPVTLKGAEYRHREGLLIRLESDDGSEGWGEAAPLPGFSRESISETSAQIYEMMNRLLDRDEIAPDWLDPDGGIDRRLHRADLSPSARFGCELGIWNTLASSGNNPLLGLAASSTPKSVPVNGLVSRNSEKPIEDAIRMREAGYRVVKLKVGGRRVAEDARLVREIGGALGDGVSVRLDANRAWGYEEAVEFARGVSGVLVDYVEEPLQDPSRLPELVRGCGLPVALDESLIGMEPEELGRHRYARAVVLKPTLIGGVSRALLFARHARGHGMKAVVSSSYESGVGIGALVALAALTGGEAAGLDTYRWLGGDVIEAPLDLPAPVVDVRRAWEAARRVDPSRLEALPIS